jgi:hypothetical protein
MDNVDPRDRAMSDDTNFIARWSRRKRALNRRAAEPGSRAAEKDAHSNVPAPSEAKLGECPASYSEFDISNLPPIDSITSDSDIRAFLQSGVPADLAKAALRRAWTQDPAIRDFIGIAENQWDFTDPAGIPGFGPLDATDDVRDLVAKAMGKLDDLPQAPEVSSNVAAGTTPSTGAPTPKDVDVVNANLDRVDRNDAPTNRAAKEDAGPAEPVAPQHESRIANLKVRKHGRALP